MTDSALDYTAESQQRKDKVDAARLRRRHRAERRFRMYGIGAIALAVLILALLLTSLVGRGFTAFTQTHLRLDVTFSEEVIDPEGARDPAVIADANYTRILVEALQDSLPLEGRRDVRDALAMVSRAGRLELRDYVLAHPDVIGTTQPFWFTASGDIDMFDKGQIPRDLPEAERRVKDKVVAWYDHLAEQGAVERRFNWRFFTQGDSRSPELAGIWGALVGSILTLAITFLLSFPIGVTTAIYLEEFAPQNRWTDLIEVNINNLAAVPSIVFGLLGLAVFLNFFGMPRSAPVVGGFTLALMTLPTIIIATRAALKAVPPSIRQAALGLGASRVQTVFHHVLPLALPGILTGTIIGMAQALGETAPLLMIGMVAFIADVPGGFTDPAAVLPVQIFLWADSPERAFVEKTAAAILVLLFVLVVMNASAVWLRKKFERRW